MNTIITINSVIKNLQEWQNANPLINDFGYGSVADFGTSRQMKYPCMWIDLETSSNVDITNRSLQPTINLIIMFLDKENIQKNVENTNGYLSNNVADIMSDQFQNCQDLLNWLIFKNREYQILNNVIVNKVTDDTTDKVYGWSMSVSITVPYKNCL